MKWNWNIARKCAGDLTGHTIISQLKLSVTLSLVCKSLSLFLWFIDIHFVILVCFSFVHFRFFLCVYFIPSHWIYLCEICSYFFLSSLLSLVSECHYPLGEQLLRCACVFVCVFKRKHCLYLVVFTNNLIQYIWWFCVNAYQNKSTEKIKVRRIGKRCRVQNTLVIKYTQTHRRDRD